MDEDLDVLCAQSKWVALAMVKTSKPFSHTAFIGNMKYAWSLAKEVKFKALGDNLFVLQFFCKGDWMKVMEEGPWIFRGNAVLIEEYDGVTRPSAISFRSLAVWARIYDLPLTFMNKSIGKKLADRIGEVVKVEVDEDGWGWGNFLRVRLKIDLEKPLTRVLKVDIRKGGVERKEFFKVKYEKMPRFCAVCGLLGHTENECGDGVHDEKDFQYGDWLIASPDRRVKAKNGGPVNVSEILGNRNDVLGNGGLKFSNQEARRKLNSNTRIFTSRERKENSVEERDLQDDASSPRKILEN